jgi:hypothetical protein
VQAQSGLLCGDARRSPHTVAVRGSFWFFWEIRVFLSEPALPIMMGRQELRDPSIWLWLGETDSCPAPNLVTKVTNNICEKKRSGWWSVHTPQLCITHITDFVGVFFFVRVETRMNGIETDRGDAFRSPLPQGFVPSPSATVYLHRIEVCYTTPTRPGKKRES